MRRSSKKKLTEIVARKGLDCKEGRYYERVYNVPKVIRPEYRTIHGKRQYTQSFDNLPLHEVKKCKKVT